MKTEIKSAEEIYDEYYCDGHPSEREDVIYVMEVHAAQFKSEWIPVSERLPEDMNHVLIYREFGWQQVGYYVKEKEYWVSEGVTHVSKVTHWMPLPTPPNQV